VASSFKKTSADADAMMCRLRRDYWTGDALGRKLWFSTKRPPLAKDKPGDEQLSQLFLFCRFWLMLANSIFVHDLLIAVVVWLSLQTKPAAVTGILKSKRAHEHPKSTLPVT
jgi:hypothetical protein